MKHLAAIALVAIALAGCSKPEDKFVGKWDGKVDVPQEAIDMIKAFSPNEAPKIETEIKGTKVELDLAKDGKYTVTTTPLSGKPSSVSGTWTLSEDGKTLTMSGPQLSEDAKAKAKAAGATDAQIKQGEGQSTAYTVGEDAKTLTADLQQLGMTIKVAFTKR
jgi:hypothetical protein